MLLYNLSLLVLLIPLMLGGCGFKPLYSVDTEEHREDVIEQLAAINVEVNGQRRIASKLSTELEYVLNPRNYPNKPQYDLIVDLIVETSPLTIQNNSEVLKYNSITRANYRLIRIQDGYQLTSGMVMANNSYGATVSQFATYSADTAATNDNLRQISRDLKQRLALMFDK